MQVYTCKEKAERGRDGAISTTWCLFELPVPKCSHYGERTGGVRGQCAIASAISLG